MDTYVTWREVSTWVQSGGAGAGTAGAGAAGDGLPLSLEELSGLLHVSFPCGLVWASSQPGGSELHM